jgi:hypothetical protein
MRLSTSARLCALLTLVLLFLRSYSDLHVSGFHFFPLLLSGNWGGRPFIAYLATFSGPTTYKRLQSQLKRGGPSREELDEHLHHERIPFYNYLSNAIFHIGRSFDTQFLYRNMLAESRGLSKSGRDTFSKLGYMLSETTYRRRIEAILEHHEQLLRCVVEPALIVFHVVRVVFACMSLLTILLVR